jgi:hypothetical protein
LEFTLTADIPALIGQLLIDWDEITSTNTAGGTWKRRFPGFVVGNIPATDHVNKRTLAETGRFGLAAQETGK